MQMLYKYEGKSQEEAINNALTDLNVTENDVYMNFEEEAAKLFKAKKVYVEVIKKSDIIDYVKEYINEFAEKFGITINSEVKIQDDIISIILVSDNNPILIGKEGRTLEAIQTLIRQAILNMTGKFFKIHMDASNYKAKKQKNLEFEIKKIAKEVLNTKVDAKLDPMNSYDRRCVHNVVSKFENLKSLSYGEGAERHVVISYKED